MRATTTVVVCAVLALVALVASCEGSWHKAAVAKHDRMAQALHGKMRMPHPLKKVAARHARGFAALQSGTPDLSGIKCAGDQANFTRALNETWQKCLSVPNALPNLDNFDPSNETQARHLRKFCNKTECGGVLSRFFDNTKHSVCLANSSLASLIMLPLIGKMVCLQADGKPCFDSLNNLGAVDKCERSDIYNEKQCNMTSHVCRWDYSEGKCRGNMNKFVGMVCKPEVGKCMTAFGDLPNHPTVREVEKVMPDDKDGNNDGGSNDGGGDDDFFPDTEEMKLHLELLCFEAGGVKCAPVVDSVFGNMGENEFRYICNSNKKFQCLMGMEPILKKASKRESTKKFYECVRYCKNQTVCVEDNYCREQYLHAEMEFDGMGEGLQKICARNAQGRWCMAVMEEHDDIGRRCAEPVSLNTTKSGGICNAKCDAELKQALDNIGCCINIGGGGDKNDGNQQYDYSKVPPYVQNNTMTRAPRPTYTPGPTESREPQHEFQLSHLGLCPSIGAGGIDEISKKQCAPVTAITTADPCYSPEWETLIEDLSVQCDGQATRAIDNLGNYPTDTEAATELGKFCNSSCYHTARKVLSPKWRRCLPSNVAQEMQAGLVFCEKASPNGEFCGIAARHFADGDCDQYDQQQSTCGAKAQCTWVGGNDGCEVQPTPQYLRTVCSPCLNKIANALGDGAAAREAAAYQQFMCVKQDNLFCFPLVAADIRKIDGLGMKNDTLAAACANRTKEKCMTKMMNGAASIETRELGAAYRKCVTELARTQEEANMCAHHVSNYIREISQTQAQVNFMCRKNAAGKFCMSMLESATSHTCLMSTISSGSCAPSCEASLETMVADFGCCIGNLHAMFMNTPVTKEMLPDVKTRNGYVPVIPKPPADHPSTKPAVVADGTKYNAKIGPAHPNNGLFLFGMCSNMNQTIVGNLTIMCARPKGNVKIKKEKKLPVSFKKIKDDPKLEQRLVDGLTQDTATALGLPREDLVNPHLEEDLSVTVVTHKRRFGVLAQSSGAKFVFEIQSTSDEATAEEAAKFDQLLADDELTLPTATEVVKDCGCKDETVQSLAVEAPPAVTAAPDPEAPVTPAPANTNTTGSSAAAASVAAALVAIVAAMLF